jgi:hypothetical protein
MTRPTERLEIIQGIVASAPVTAASRPAKVQMVHGEVVAGSAPLTFEAVSFQRGLSLAAEVKVIACFPKVSVKSFFRDARHAQARDFRASYRRAFRTPCLWAAVIDVIGLTIRAFVGRSDNASVAFASIPFQALPVVSGADDGDARGTYLLALARGFVDYATLTAGFVAKSIARLSVCFEGAWDATLCVWGLLYHPLATAGTDDGSVRSCCHGSSYHGGWQIV